MAAKYPKSLIEARTSAYRLNKTCLGRSMAKRMCIEESGFAVMASLTKFLAALDLELKKLVKGYQPEGMDFDAFYNKKKKVQK